MYLSQTDMSCGVHQMCNINEHKTPKEVLIKLADEIYTEEIQLAFVQWSDIWGRTRMGNKLYHFIRRKFPKSNVQRTKKATNPNSTNIICLYTWKIPRGFKGWWKKNSKRGKCSSNKYKMDWCTEHGCYPEFC